MQDPITLEDIPSNRLISFQQYGVTFHYDIRTLASMYQRDGSLYNPLNMSPLPEDISNKVKKYVDENTLYITYRNNVIPLYLYDTIGESIIQIYRSLSSLQEIGKEDIYLVCDNGRKISMYTHDLTNTLRSILPCAHPYIDMKNTPGAGLRMHKLYRFSIQNNIEWIENIIDSKYRNIPNINYTYNSTDESLLLDFVRIHRDKDEEYVSKGIIRLASGSEIRASVVRDINISLIDNVKNTNNRELWNNVFHVLYIHVVDPTNIIPGSDLRNQYYVDPWE